MGTPEHPAEHRAEHGRSTAPVSPPQRAQREHRAGLLAELLWSCFVMGVPLGAGLAVNAGFGWWPGLAAFLIAAVPAGVIAYRADPRRRR